MLKVWAVTMVANEVDIAYDALYHIISEKVDGVVVADNLSDDGTRDALERIKKDAPCPVIIVTDRDPGYWQSVKMTKLAHLAAHHGADWIVPFDIDELWSGNSMPLAQLIQSDLQLRRVVGLPSHTYTCTGYDDPDAPSVFQRMRYRIPYASKYPKVMYRYDPNFVIGMGNDEVRSAGIALAVDQVLTDTAQIAHFPIRSPEQFVSKMRRGARAYAHTTLDKRYGAHWRAYGRILERYGEDVMRTIFFSQFFSAEPWRLGLVEVPSPWCKWRH